MRFLQPQSPVAQALSAARSTFGSLPNLLRRTSGTPSVGSPQSPEPSDALHAEDSVSLPRSLSLSRPTFEENLQSQCFSEASRQLIGREECLFGSDQQDQDEEAWLRREAGLRRDYEALLEGVWQTVRKSLQPLDQSEQAALKEAVLAIQQEEEQDRKWEETERRRPDWRPWRCRHAHDSLLEEMVRERVQGAEPYSKGGVSSIERELIGLGQRIRLDLLQVARQVRGCYHGDAGVCQAYARLYHSAFSARLQGLAQYGLDTQDRTHLLSWTNHHYPSILQDPELLSEVKAELLEPLLPADVLKPLVEQHLEDKETELRRCLRSMLEREELGWKNQTAPKMIDSCHFSPLAIDVIQCVDANLKSVLSVGGDETHRHRMVATLEHFFSRYKGILDKVMKQNGTHSRSVVMANLTCLRLFREFLTGDVSCPGDVRTHYVSMVTSMRDSCHTHLTSNIHQDLQEAYRKLWSPSWLKSSSSVCEQLRDGLRPHLQHLRTLDPTCRQELLAVLHEEVLVEYVKRMMKRKMKLKNKQQQEQAAAALCDDSQEIHTLFTDAGCRVEWLGRVLPLISELLRIQDPDTILLELVTLTSELPDVSIGHISALLQLKSGLSEKNCKKIKNFFVEELTGAPTTHTHSHTHTPARLFFSKVKLK